MKNSGYSEHFRAEVLKSGLKGYSKIVAADEAGVRPKNWEVSARRLEKRRKKKNW